MMQSWPKRPWIRLNDAEYARLHRQILDRDSWRCQGCGSSANLEVHHRQFRSQSGHDAEDNLITLCSRCHSEVHSD